QVEVVALTETVVQPPSTTPLVRLCVDSPALVPEPLRTSLPPTIRSTGWPPLTSWTVTFWPLRQTLPIAYSGELIVIPLPPKSTATQATFAVTREQFEVPVVSAAPPPPLQPSRLAALGLPPETTVWLWRSE